MLFFLLSLDGSSPIPLPVAGVVSARDPAWAPDGRRLAFTCEFPATTQICIYDPNGPLVRFAVAGVSSNSEPSWSPDGSRIAFTAYANVAVADASGGGASFLTHGFSPDWSPDGTRLVFADVGGLYTINADGSNRQRLTPGSLRSPAWRR
jgi:dipeptidyl aminopeptidase/acylaminoacyl peptidase